MFATTTTHCMERQKWYYIFIRLYSHNGSIHAKEFIERRNKAIRKTIKISVLWIKLFCFGLFAILFLVKFPGLGQMVLFTKFELKFVVNVFRNVLSTVFILHHFVAATTARDPSNNSSNKHCKRWLWFTWKGGCKLCVIGNGGNKNLLYQSYLQQSCACVISINGWEPRVTYNAQEGEFSSCTYSNQSKRQGS